MAPPSHMRTPRPLWSIGVGLLALLSLAAAAPPDKPEEKPAPAPRIDEVPLPPNGILVLCERAADVLRALPRVYALTPEQFESMKAELERLRQAQARQPVPVSEWRVTGKVVGARAELKVRLIFVTPTDGATVVLGCRQGHPNAVTLDGEVAPINPLLAEGLALEVEKKGRHEAVVDLLVPLREVAPADRPRTPLPVAVPGDALLGFELDLPLSAVTLVELDLPEGARMVEVNDQPLREPLTLEKNELSGPLGKVNRLKVGWKGPGPAANTQAPLLDARSRVTVRLVKKEVHTEAELTLQDMTRTVKEWQLRLPEQATVRLANPKDQALLDGPIQGSGSKDGKVTIVLKAPLRGPLVLVVNAQQQRGSGAVPLGPFTVLRAGRQRGTVWVVGEADQRDQRAALDLAGAGRGQPLPWLALSPRRLDERDETGPPPAGALASYQFWTTAAVETSDPRQRDPWFQLDLRTVQGFLDVRVKHTLRLPAADGAGWSVLTALDAVPVQTGVASLEVELPAPWKFDRERGPRPAGLVTDTREDPAQRTLRFELSGTTLKPFELQMEAEAGEPGKPEPFPAVSEHAGATALVRLPRPRGVRKRGGHEVVITAPDTIDLRQPQPPNPGMELIDQKPQQLVWRSERDFPTQVAVAWRPNRVEWRVTSLADVVVSGSEVRVKQRLSVAAGSAPRADLVLLVPRELADRLEVGGASLVEAGPGAGPALRRVVRWAGKPGDPPPELVLQYRLRRPRNAAGVRTVPLVAVENAPRPAVKVRVWGEPAERLSALEDAWETGPPEVVASEDRLPSLVLNASRPAQVLTLRGESVDAAEGRARANVERTLIHATVTEGGFQQYRVRLRLREMPAGPLEMLFPAPLAALDVKASLDGKAVRCDPVSPARPGAELSPEERRTGQLVLPAVGRSALLEVNYQLAPGRSAESGTLRSILQPPGLPGLWTGVPTRWQVDLPPGWMAVSTEGGAGASWRWGWRGWLYAPRPAARASDLEEWLTGEEVEQGEDAEPAFVCWRSDLSPVTVYHVPQQAWLLACSVLVLVVGLAVAATGATGPGGRSRRLFWVLLALLVLGASALGLLWPGVLVALIYGAQPGAAVLLLILGAQWLLHERYRRRVVFLPGFRRSKGGSSMVRTAGSTGQRPRERPLAAPGREATPTPGRARQQPSTVDEPARPEEDV